MNKKEKTKRNLNLLKWSYTRPQLPLQNFCISISQLRKLCEKTVCCNSQSVRVWMKNAYISKIKCCQPNFFHVRKAKKIIFQRYLLKNKFFFLILPLIITATCTKSNQINYFEVFGINVELMLNSHLWNFGWVYVNWKSILANRFLGFQEKFISVICEFWCLFFT